MSASSSAIQPAISSAVNTRGSGSAAPSARSREARKSINSCFSAGESETAAASMSASVTMHTSVHASTVNRKAYVPRPRANGPNHFLSPACSFLQVSGCVGFCVALLRAPSVSSGKTEVCVILLGQLRHSCLEWHHEAGGGKPFCLSVFLEVTCTSSSQSVGGSRVGNTECWHPPPHPCRPSSALVSTHLGTNAEPVPVIYSGQATEVGAAQNANSEGNANGHSSPPMTLAWNCLPGRQPAPPRHAASRFAAGSLAAVQASVIRIRVSRAFVSPLSKSLMAALISANAKTIRTAGCMIHPDFCATP